MKKKTEFQKFRKQSLGAEGSFTAITILNFFSVRLAYFMHKRKSKITPNHITLLRMFVLSPLTLIFLFLAPIFNLRIYYLFVAILFYLILFTDDLDGNLARGRKQTSPSGALLDSISDRLAVPLFLTFIFSVALFLDNLFLLYGVILVFVLKTVNLMIISKVLFYKNLKKSQVYDLFGRETLDRMKVTKTKGILGRFKILLTKTLGLKPYERWAGYLCALDYYTAVIIIPSLLMFFGLDLLTLVIFYILITLLTVFYLHRIKDLLWKYI
jgi:phosphatidylglycerophosphate synthase